MPGLTMEGTLVEIRETQMTGKNSDFAKRKAVIQVNDNPMYPMVFEIEFTKDKIGLLDKFAVGEQVEVSVNLNGRKWTSPEGNDVYFKSLSVWRIKAMEGVLAVVHEEVSSNVEDDDLPF